MPLALEAQSLNHWAAREVPICNFLTTLRPRHGESPDFIDAETEAQRGTGRAPGSLAPVPHSFFFFLNVIEYIFV